MNKKKAENRAELKRERARHWVSCTGCNKSRVLYNPAMLPDNQLSALQLWLEGFDFVCGYDLRGCDGNTWLVRSNEALTCHDVVEATFYCDQLTNQSTYTFQCYHCDQWTHRVQA